MAGTGTLPLPKLRAPHHHGRPIPDGFVFPAPKWLKGAWHVTHSSLPLWNNKRNVCITYTPLPEDDKKLGDIVSYQTLNSPAVKTVHGIDTPAPEGAGIYNWRGKGWLKIASSRWEILGWGEGEAGEQWIIIYFAKTLFTPAGVDVYSRQKKGINASTLNLLKEALAGVDGENVESEFSRLVGALFEVTRDGEGAEV